MQLFVLHLVVILKIHYYVNKLQQANFGVHGKVTKSIISTHVLL